MKTHFSKFPMMKIQKFILGLLVIISIFTSCKKDIEEVELSKPTADNIEIGTANNKQSLRGRDFHFNADVLAATKISSVEVKIIQKAGETYTAAWKLELSWPEYAGVKNTTVHKHFTMPIAAPEGKYDFYFIVIDENGTKLELKESLTITDPANMPVDPKIGRDFVIRNGKIIYYTDKYVEKELIFKKGDTISLHAQVSEIKGDGILYSVLVKKKINYNPESIDKLDFNKAIVITKVEHQGLASASKITTYKIKPSGNDSESIVVGAAVDANEPKANPIAGEKAWESGQYNWIILYKNTTHSMSVYKSIPITINY